jgi:hypothetical protein
MATALILLPTKCSGDKWSVMRMKDSNSSENFNKEFDKLLNQTEILTKDMLNKFYEAYAYDSATPYNWLVKKLKIIGKRLTKGDTLQIEGSKRILDKSNFMDWIESEFPYAKSDLISIIDSSER